MDSELPPQESKTAQGFKVYYAPSDAQVDIIAVPGLAVHPEKNWTWADKDITFNWLEAKDGLQKDFPQARIMLFQYNSQYRGENKVKTALQYVAYDLLTALRNERTNCLERPIVFIGHSMGGLVVAQAIVYAFSRNESYPKIFQCFVGGLFVGVPFHGTPFANFALMYASVVNLWGEQYYKDLLEVMKETDAEGSVLNELRDQLRFVETRLEPKLEFYCIYECVSTDFGQLFREWNRSSSINKILGRVISMAPSPTKQIFVERRSATLDGLEKVKFECQHRDMVRFKNTDSPRYKTIIERLGFLIKDSKRRVCDRINRSGERMYQPALHESETTLHSDNTTTFDSIKCAYTEPSKSLGDLECKPSETCRADALVHPIAAVPRDRNSSEIALICTSSLVADCVLKAFDMCCKDEDKEHGELHGGPNQCTTGVICGYNVVLLNLPGTGNNNATVAAETIRASFPNVYLALVLGICGSSGGLLPDGTDNENIRLDDGTTRQALIQHNFAEPYPEESKSKNTIQDNLDGPSLKMRDLFNKLRTDQYKGRMQSTIASLLQQIQPNFPEAGPENDRPYPASYSAACNCGKDEQICDATIKMYYNDLWMETSSSVARDRSNITVGHPMVYFNVTGLNNNAMESEKHHDKVSMAHRTIDFEKGALGIQELFPPVAVIRGICCGAVSHTCKRWQLHAAETAVACMKAVLLGLASTDGLSQDELPFTHLNRKLERLGPRNDPTRHPDTISRGNTVAILDMIGQHTPRPKALAINDMKIERVNYKLQNHFREWLNSSGPNCLWLYGDAAIHLSSIVIQIGHELKLPVIYHCCDRAGKRSKDIRPDQHLQYLTYSYLSQILTYLDAIPDLQPSFDASDYEKWDGSPESIPKAIDLFKRMMKIIPVRVVCIIENFERLEGGKLAGSKSRFKTCLSRLLAVIEQHERDNGTNIISLHRSILTTRGRPMMLVESLSQNRIAQVDVTQVEEGRFNLRDELRSMLSNEKESLI